MILEIVRDFDYTYYCNLDNISEYISLAQLKKELKKEYGIVVNSLKEKNGVEKPIFTKI